MKHITISPQEITPDILYCNGDSWAWGSELGDESEAHRLAYSFPGLLSKHYNLPLLNSASPGGSNQRIVRTTVEDISRLLLEGRKPLVIITWTLIHRFELFSQVKNNWTNFSASTRGDDQKLAEKIWTRYSSDETDVINFLTQVVLLESFLKKNNIPYLMLNTFDTKTVLLRQDIKDLFVSQMDLTYYMVTMALRHYVMNFPNIDWGPGDHPLENGHELVADFLKTHIDLRFILK